MRSEAFGDVPNKSISVDFSVVGESVGWVD